MSETVYKKVDPTLRSLIDDIKMGEIGLPDLQRPFVWKNAKVRNLFDSMYRGFPVGYLLFWEPATVSKSKAIGADGKQKAPRLLIVDGQQRLTALFAVITGTEVIREGYEAEKIEIAFNPLSETFEVADAAIRRDRFYLPNITELWKPDADIFEIAENYLGALGEVREITSQEAKQVRKALNRLCNLMNYPFTALELSSSVDEEQVSEVFVRINSEGKKLNQADFILTLMSVFWDEGRKELEDFCRRSRLPSKNGASPFNYFIQPDPDQLLRVSVGLAFRRARLKSVYSILRGKDLETEQFSDERRDEQFARLKDAQSRVLNLQYWHDFLKALRDAGFSSDKMISSQNNLLFAYTLYLLGRTEFKISEHRLRRLIARWFFMSSLTGRYTSSPESKMEFDLARLRDVNASDEFETVLDATCAATVTNDFWEITLPTDLATSSARSPSMFAYLAALNLLDAKVLYSTRKVAEMLDPSTRAPRAAIERHHLFPKRHLEEIGVKRNRDKNQIANFALIEWGDNASVSHKAPADYVPKMESRVSARDLERMHYWHALPDGWAGMEYEAFLRRRREMMARVIRDAYQTLCDMEEGAVAREMNIEAIISEGETATTEFKSTLRVNLHTGQPDERMESAVLKTIVAFLNSRGGGALVIGVSDDGEPLGAEADGFPNEDKMYLHLVNLIRDRIGAQNMLYVHPRFDDFEDVRVLAVDCLPARAPVYLKEGNEQRLYVRTGAASTELKGTQAHAYVSQRF